MCAPGNSHSAPAGGQKANLSFLFAYSSTQCGWANPMSVLGCAEYWIRAEWEAQPCKVTLQVCSAAVSLNCDQLLLKCTKVSWKLFTKPLTLSQPMVRPLLGGEGGREELWSLGMGGWGGGGKGSLVGVFQRESEFIEMKRHELRFQATGFCLIVPYAFTCKTQTPTLIILDISRWWTWNIKP